MTTQTPTFALPTEPALEFPTEALRRTAIDADFQGWLLALQDESNVHGRSESLFRFLRKDLLEAQAAARLLAVGSGAAAATGEGVAALAALVAVRAPAHEVIDAVGEFFSLHRLGERLERRKLAGERLAPDEQAVLDEAAEIQALCREHPSQRETSATALPHPRDLGPAGACRKWFASVVGEWQQKGNLSREEILLFARVAELELSALQLRASALAGCVNPLSPRHRNGVMPRLAAVEAELQNLRAFTGLLKRDPRIAHFQGQLPSYVELLDDRERELLLQHTAAHEALWPLRRLLAGIHRSPTTLRELSYYVARLYSLGEALVNARLRKHPIDPLEACLMAVEFQRDRAVRMPAGERVLGAVGEAIRSRRLDSFQIAGNEIVLPFDASVARRIAAPAGLPLPQQASAADGEIPEDQSVKDLVMENINNTTMLAGFLRNPKVVGTPGIVELIVSRTRASAILDTICNSRHLHSGYANKGVPLALLRSPMKIPVKSLRRFVSVRYINKVELRRLSVDVSSIRREVVDEVVAYLKSLN